MHLLLLHSTPANRRNNNHRVCIGMVWGFNIFEEPKFQSDLLFDGSKEDHRQAHVLEEYHSTLGWFGWWTTFFSLLGLHGSWTSEINLGDCTKSLPPAMCEKIVKYSLMRNTTAVSICGIIGAAGAVFCYGHWATSNALGTYRRGH